ncbi:MAG: zinc-dependent alcohol dehydrogenase [Methanobacteriota archaeon]
MRATVLAYRWRAPESAALEDVPPPRAGPEQAVVDVRANGVCRSDLHFYHGVLEHAPCTMGHEGAGVVESVGANVTRVLPGDRVVVNYVNPDGTCPMCRRGRTDLCERPPLGFGTDGVFADAVAVDARNVVPLPDSVPFDEAAILGCAGATAYHATLASGLAPGMSCLILGLGGVGMQGVEMAKRFGASPLVAVDVRGAKLAVARRLGADVVVDASTEDVVRVARSLGDGRGVDVAFEYVGMANTLNQAIAAVRWGGCAMMVGIPKGPITIDAQGFNLGGKTLAATQGHTTEDLREVVALRAKGALRTAETITHRMPFKDVAHAIEVLENQAGDPVRIALLH